MSSHEDKIWVDGNRKLDAICQDVLDATAGQLNVLVLAHFKSTLSVVEERLRTRAIAFSAYMPLDFSALCLRDSESTSVRVGLASYFQARSPVSATEQSRSYLRILIAEHHPLSARDDAVLEAARSLSCNAEVINHTSLTDSLMTYFGGGKIRGLMEQLGMEEQECVSSPVITRAIRRAQEQIKSRIQREMQTNSPEEWFRFNLPPTSRPF